MRSLILCRNKALVSYVVRCICKEVKEGEIVNKAFCAIDSNGICNDDHSIFSRCLQRILDKENAMPDQCICASTLLLRVCSESKR